MSIESSEIESLRENLLDTSRRNSLIIYKGSKVRTIEIVDEDPTEVYNRLAIEERTMYFRPTVEGSIEKGSEEDEDISIELGEGTSPKGGRLTDKYLDTPYDQVQLDKRLFKTFNNARTVFEEQGYPILSGAQR